MRGTRAKVLRKWCRDRVFENVRSKDQLAARRPQLYRAVKRYFPRHKQLPVLG